MSKPTFLGPLIGKGAGQYELVNAERGSVLATHVEPAFDSKTRRRGLLGRDSVPENYALIIAPCSGVHTFSMRFPIDAVFVSRDGTVVKTCREVKPWRIAGAFRAFAVIEAAAGFIDRTETEPGDVMALCEIPQKRRVTDALPQFATASTHAAGVPRARRTDSSKRVTLADIIARKTPLGWFESVAVVQELCEVVLARGPAHDPRVPELKHIALTPDGRVELLAEGPAEHSTVHRAGLVLLALTPEAQLPMQLRLLALEEVSPAPRFTSLKELHSELEFFERPDRLDIVRGVYERFEHRAVLPLAEAVIPPPLLEPPPPRRPKSAWWKRRKVRMGVRMGLIAVLTAASAWEWRRPEGQWLRSGVAQLSRAASVGGQKVVQAARDELKVVTGKLGITKRQPMPDSPIRMDVVTATRDQTPARTDTLASRPVTQREGSTTASTRLPIDFVRAPQGSAPQPEAPILGAPGAVTVDADLVGTGSSVYSADNLQVVRPSLVSPRLPKGPPPGVRLGELPEVELVISTTVEVESVELLSAVPGAQSGMKLSAVKAWRFQPATLNGQPVRYRYRVRLMG